ncbi:MULTISPECIES: beta-ketoacyl-[acyl-carrier-protein] synthase family protein [unclassified Capnocytophaga]|uniref:beta-ketoacyl-[acyl-carrier-protein] synthase family protein n=1 Tax=unclassified Capnocytophaga TaxID=2640652 RepID=UPI000202CBB0|nr:MULTISPECIES: beta-ketoacyl-[acyl-carrier-protein] synthase family protein [unclassified Capnocytophaga]EGD35043.1 3-oxoacyl-(acyl-carrier-protein) synthase II [Capnocytophaga sp. oral taxon 338 str. F0234]MEB3003911.1 beta-ketoacyl-[acyl-carrier-protein] synthase family protein [Capnocytophaga sp. G2]
MKSERIVITGMGICSCIGKNIQEHLLSLLKGNTGLSTIENIDTIYRNHIRVGEIKQTNASLIESLHLPEDNNFSRTSLLGILALREALESIPMTKDNFSNIAMVMASSVGGMDMTEKYFYQYTTDVSSRKYIFSHNIGEITGQIADFFGIKGLVTSLSTACSSSANAIITAADLIRTGRAKYVAVGGADALSKFTINGFNALMILSDEDCTPFDENRKGLNLGEAGAFLILESEKEALYKGHEILAELSGWGNANDAYHQTASSKEGEGAFLAMQEALKISGLSPREIDYVNAHGTATINNDLSESRALIRVFSQEKMPDFSSTKPFTGHTLAVASAVEAIFSILAIREGIVFPNLNFRTPMKEVIIRPQTVLKKKNINHVLSNSFGFGGNCSSLIFSKYNY